MLQFNELTNRKSVFKQQDEEEYNEYNDEKKNSAIHQEEPHAIWYCCFLLFRIVVGFVCIYIFLFLFILVLTKQYEGAPYEEFKYNTFQIKTKPIDLTEHYFHKYPHLHLYMNNNENITNPCVNPESTVCDNYKGDMVSEVTKDSITRITNRTQRIIVDNAIHSKHVNERFLKKQHIEGLNRFYHKCLDFYNDGYLLRLMDSKKMRDLIVIVDSMKKYEDIGKTFGELYSKGINVPIKLTIKGVYVDSVWKKMLSMEMSGIPLLYLINGSNRFKNSIIHLFEKRVGNFLDAYWKNSEKKKRHLQASRKIYEHLMNIGLRDKTFHYPQNNIQTVKQLKKRLSSINIEEYFLHSSINKELYEDVGIEINKLEFFSKLDTSIRQFDMKEWRMYLKMNVIYTAIRWFTMDELKKPTIGDKCMKLVKQYYPITFCRGFKSVLSKSKYHDEELSAAIEIKKNTKLLISKYMEVIDYNPTIVCLKQKQNIERLKERLKNIEIRSCKCSNIDHMNRRMGLIVPSVLKEEHRTLESNVFEGIDFSDILFTLNEFQTRRLESNYDYGPYYENISDEMLTGNAFYDKVFKNQLIIPPGMFVFPYYSKNFKSWQLFSNLMTVISHELGHTVDTFLYRNQALSFEEIKCYEGQVDCIIDLYNGFRRDRQDTEMGERTCFENKADMLGLYISYYTWLDTVKNSEKHLVDNYKQHFFIFYHQTWCQKGEQKKDAHADNKLRVSLPISLLKHEYKIVFDCKSDYFYEKINKCLL
jgi:predicted metalloendopeptidase